ncbi:MAG: response regulator [Magnetococcales bacterium]|nr:response regulator [Magnetococcales bacterium]
MISPFKMQSLKSRLILQFATFVGASLLLVTSLMTVYMVEIVRDNLIAEYEEEAEDQFLSLNAHLDELAANIQQLAENPLIVQALIDRNKREEYLPQLARNFAAGRNVVAFILVDYSGAPLFVDRDVPANYNDSLPLREALGLDRSAIMVDLNKKNLIFSYPIQYFDTTQGAVVVHFDLEKILARTTRHSERAQFFFYFDDVPLHKEPIATGQDLITLSILPTKEDEWIYKLKMRVVITIDEGSFLEPIHRTVIDEVLLILAILIGAILLAFRIGRRTAAPILKLCQQVRNSSRKEGLFIGPVGTGDELEELAETFKQQTIELWKIQDNLESRVVERTQDLYKANQSLENEILVRRQAESFAQKNQQIMEQAQSIAHLGSWEWVMETNQLFWSAEVFRIFGLDQSTINPTYSLLLSHIHPDDVNEVKNNIQASLNSTNKSYSVEHRIIRADKQVRHVLESGIIFRDEQGDPQRMLGIIHDITQRKTFEMEIEKARHDSEMANRAKSDFLANMSHEIRTPMNAIIGLSHLCGQTKLSSKQRDYQRKIENSAHSLLRLINDILDFSKIEAGKLSMEQRSFTLSEILDSVNATFTVKCSEKKLAFSFNSADTIPNHLIGDSFRLLQVLNNLVGNAVKFTERGRISLSVEPLEQSDQEVTLQFSIQDSGIGMTYDQIASLFQPFHQADTSITRRYGGTGLGLVISKRLVKMMGGEIRVESQPGVGSTFRFTTKMKYSKDKIVARSELVPLKHAKKQLSGARILLVEDNEINQQVAQEILKAMDAEVTVANNGLESVNLAIGGHFDAVLMDVQMPVMDGFAATEEIRKQISSDVLPILAMTANVMAGDREKCLKVGMNDHIAKPIEPARLYDALIRHIRAKPGTPPNQPDSFVITTDQSHGPDAVAFPDLAGIDVKTGIRNVGGNQDLYLKILTKYTNNQRNAAKIMAASLQNGHLKEIIQTAHTLKGVSATIGATTLAMLAATIEKAVQEQKKSKRISKLIKETQAELSRIISTIEDSLPTKSTETDSSTESVLAEESVSVTPEQLTPLLQQAMLLLNAFDSSVEQVIEQITPLARTGERRKHLEFILDKLGQYDYDACSIQLQQWAQEEGIPLNVEVEE